MLKGTHFQGGLFISVFGFWLLKINGLLLPDEVLHWSLQWLLMYPFAIWGSLAPDLDHNPNSIPMKDIVSRAVYTVLHITNPVRQHLRSKKTEAELKHSKVYGVANTLCAKHRSWQTHSDLTLAVLVLVLVKLISGAWIIGRGNLDTTILRLILTGVTMGMTAHLFLDMLTPDGITLIGMKVLNVIRLHFNPKRSKLPETLHLVPHKGYFATGGKWESKVRWVVHKLTWLSVIYLGVCVIYPLIAKWLPFEIALKF